MTVISTYTNAGTIVGAGEYLTVTSAGTINSPTYGVQATTGTVSNSGTITGASDGVELYSASTLNNSGSIGGASLSVGVYAHASTVTNNGSVTGYDAGVRLQSASTLDNENSISGTYYGVLANASTVTNNGSITGGRNGVQLLSASTLDNTGFIKGSEYPAPFFGIGVYANAASDLITNSGTITGLSDGVYMAFTSSLVNGGIISSIYGNGDGVRVNGGMITNADTGTITGWTVGVRMIFESTLDNQGYISGQYYGVDAEQLCMVTNTGTITADLGVQLNFGSTLNNNGYIDGVGDGVRAYFSTVINTGTILGHANTAVSLYSPGASPYYSPSALDNGGFISGKYYGVNAQSSTITNSGTISGGRYGVASHTSTVSNSGTISGGTFAVDLFSASTLNVLSGAVFNGGVKDDGTGVLNLAGTAAGTLDMGGSFTGFKYISFGSAAWTLEGTSSELANGETIAGFALGDTLVLEGFTATSETYVSGTGLELSDGTTTVTLDLTGSFSGTDQFSITDTAQGTDITLCFYPGTRIATPGGEVAVEDLRAGDMVLTANGPMPVRWLGQSTVATRFANKLRSLPVRLRAGVLGNGLPKRDLLVSSDHALFLEGILVQAGALVDGVNIRREYDVPVQFTYYHVELASHELLLAEGVLTESFVDNLDRMHFQNWNARETPTVPIMEMPYLRAKSARQLPAALRARTLARCMAI